MKLTAIPFVIASCLGVGWAVFQDSLWHSSQVDAPTASQLVAVEVTRPQRRDVQDSLELVGSLVAGRDVEIRSRVAGRILGLSVDLGDEVRAGQVLIQVDDLQQRELVRQASAARKVTVSEQAAQRVRVEVARREKDRVEKLTRSGVSTPQQRDLAKSQLAIAEAELKLADSKVAQAESALEHSKLALAEREIRSPLDGRVAARLVQTGDLAKPDVALLRIVDLSTVRTAIHVGESDFRRLRTGQEAAVSVDSYPRTFVGRVERMAPVLDPLTRTAVVYVAVENSAELLKPGMHSRVRIVLERHADVLVVPMTALVDSPAGRVLFVVPAGKETAQCKEIQTGLIDGQYVEILSGIGPQDRVVTWGSHLVEDGQVVQVVEPGIGADPSAGP